MHRRAKGSALEGSEELTAITPRPVSDDTIAAISTPTGEGAIALIRISGPDAVAVAERIFRGKEPPFHFAPNVQHFGEIVESGRLIDQVMISVHRAPASYNGDDMDANSYHGVLLTNSRLLDASHDTGAS